MSEWLLAMIMAQGLGKDYLFWNVTNNRTIFLPVLNGEKSKARTAGFRLLVSRDFGKTWIIVDEGPRKRKIELIEWNLTVNGAFTFRYQVPDVGIYWFFLQTLDEGGEPDQLPRPHQKLFVRK